MSRSTSANAWRNSPASPGTARSTRAHGWGCAYIADGAWKVYHDIKPIWEDDLSQFGATTLLLGHARSAFRDENIVVENNMPFHDDRYVFAFNGELRGVRISAEGRIGAEKVFNFVKRFDKGDMAAAMRKGMDIIVRRTRYVRAMNMIIADRENVYVGVDVQRGAGIFQAARTGGRGWLHGELRDRARERLVARHPQRHGGAPSMILVKIGGGGDINLPGIAEDLAAVSDPFIVVHGANAVRDVIAEKLGNPTQVVTSVSGYTSVLSDKAALDAILMGYAGVQNKRIVELLQQNGVNAVGLSGIDGRAIQGQRNKGIRVRKNGKTLIVRDFSGKPRSANKELFQLLLDGGYAPVLSIPIIDERHTAINSENDDIINVLQAAFHAEVVLQLIEAPGFLADKDDESTVVPTIRAAELEQREAQVEGAHEAQDVGAPKAVRGGRGKGHHE